MLVARGLELLFRAMTMSAYTLVVEPVTLPAVVIHGGAGAYLSTTSAALRKRRGQLMRGIATDAQGAITEGPRSAVLHALAAMEREESFNAGYGSRLQRDGVARLSASLMDGRRSRLSAVYNVRDCIHPSLLANALQDRADRNLDGEGAALLMRELGIAPEDVRSPKSLERWRKLVSEGDAVDREGAIGDAGSEGVERAKTARIPVPEELEAIPAEDRHGTVGAVAASSDGELWAGTSTGGRGHESVGRVSDSPTPAGNYACSRVALSATGFGEQILDLDVCGRIATRMIDGASIEEALRRTFDEIAAFGGLLGVIAITAEGEAGYAHTTEACGISWIDATGGVHVDRHGR